MPVESIKLLLQNSRQTYASDYHDHTAQTDSVSELNPKLLQYYLSFIVHLINQSIHPSLLHHLELAFSSKVVELELTVSCSDNK